MEPVQYLRALRRRWVVIVAAGVVALAAGALVTRQTGNAPPVERFEATTVLFGAPTGPRGFIGNRPLPPPVDINTASVFATIGEVPQRAAQALDFPGTGVQLVSRYAVRATVDETTGLLKITAIADDPDTATQVADSVAGQLIDYLEERQAQAIDDDIVQPLEASIKGLEKEIAGLNRQLAAAPDGTPQQQRLLATLTSKQVALEGLRTNYNEATSYPVTSGLEVLQPAVPRPTTGGTLPAPRSRTARLLVAGILGLLAGAGLALVLERFDRRIRSKDAAERHFGFPVLAEIPFVPRWRLRRHLITAEEHGTTFPADAFRLLMAALTKTRSEGRSPESAEGSWSPPKAILVTSPGPGEGKSTVVANLAATFAEAGKSVIVMSCDFHRPSLHEMFGVPNRSGLAQALQASNGSRVLDGHVFQTPLPRLRVVPSGARPEHPAELLSSSNMRRAIQEARSDADVVLLDTAPFLAGSEAALLIDHIDAVLLVSCAGKTSPELAERTGEFLKRMRAPVVGVALTQARDVSLPRGYYRYTREAGAD